MHHYCIVHFKLSWQYGEAHKCCGIDTGAQLACMNIVIIFGFTYNKQFTFRQYKHFKC